MASRYPGLASVKDPDVQRVLKLLFDMHAGLQQQTTGLAAQVTTASSQLGAVPAPSKPADAVSLSYLQHYVEARVGASVAAAVSSIPGAPGGPPVTPPTNPTVPPSGNPATGSLIRGFDPSVASIYNSPTDIAAWPVTGSISKVSILPGQGVYITCNKVGAQNASPPVPAGLWPQDQTAYPDAIGLEYTTWIFLDVGGTWAGSGVIQMWYGRPGTGSSPIGQEFANLWCYDARWGTLNGQAPPPGTTMGFMVAAGNQRGYTGVSTVRERSEVVQLALPDGNGGTYS
jgi:hypothetical protein